VAVGLGWGGPVTLMSNFVKRGMCSRSFVRNKLE
jgi:hypothetical protein